VRISAVSLDVCHVLTVEDVSDRVLVEQQLVESEKQAMLGLLACGILRDLANPIEALASTLVFARSALGTLTSEEVAEVVDLGLQRLNHARQLIGTQPRMPVRVSSRHEVADLHEVLRQCLTSVGPEAQRRGIRLVSSFAPPAAACDVNVRLIRNVFLNLLTNAIEAMPGGGRLEVRTLRRGDGATAPAVLLVQVIDSGVGIPEADLRRVFRPLFSTKPGAAGLGLSFCRQAVEEHGGQVRLTSRGPNEGTVATVSLPLRV
jgi:signal transduction histidine kinase